MRTVWKWTLVPGEWTRIAGIEPVVVHVGVDPLWLGDQGKANRQEANLPSVWVELEPIDASDLTPDSADAIELTFIGTGQALPSPVSQHVGSCVTPGGLVWHIYQQYA